MAVGRGAGGDGVSPHGWLQVPATRQKALENVSFSRVFYCSNFSPKISFVEATEGKSQRKIDGIGRDVMTQSQLEVHYARCCRRQGKRTCTGYLAALWPDFEIRGAPARTGQG
jgi:hypothetical protein